MEPFKALVLLAGAAIVSLVAAGAGGFYAGYSAGRGNLEEIKAHISGAQALIPSGDGGTVSLKPLLDDMRALGKRVEALAVVKANAAADSDSGTKLVLDEIRGLSTQIDSLKQDALKPLHAPAVAIDRPSSTPPAPDYTGALQEIRDQVRALNARFEKPEPKAPKGLADDVRALSASIQALEPNLRRALGDEVRSAIATSQNAEPKTSKALLDEVKSLSSSLQSQEPNMRRVVAEELSSAVASLQNAEPKASKALLDEVKSLNSSLQSQEPNIRRVVAEELRSAVASLQNAEPKAPKALLDEVKSLSSSLQSQEPNIRRVVAEELHSAAASPQHAEPKASKALLDEVKSLNSSLQSQEPNIRRVVAEELRSTVASLQNAEPKAPKAILDEVRALSSLLQSQEPNIRRAVAEELRSAVTNSQNAEPKVSKAMMDEIRAISTSIKVQETRPQTPQASVVDQIKVLQASVEALKVKLDERERGRNDGAANADIAQLHQLVATASDQFSKCQTRLVAPGAGAGAQQAATTAAAITVSQEKKLEPTAVVFYDNVMLKKDQEKQYDEIGVKLSLQSVGPRQVRVAVNQKGFGLSFGERKVFRSQDVECEINLMETNLNDLQARISISCKR